ncbi:MAG: hypothetical protein FWG33_04435, partial [Oscillospiraceae bacterium]|nr:hypothetical protein [Oscillospiraceae bacterium]
MTKQQQQSRLLIGKSVDNLRTEQVAKKDINMKVAMLQMIPTDDEKANRDKGVAFCKEAKNKGADLAVFPELFNVDYEKLLIGYNADNSKGKKETLKLMQEKAVDLDSDFIQTFKKLSKEL